MTEVIVTFVAIDSGSPARWLPLGSAQYQRTSYWLTVRSGSFSADPLPFREGPLFTA